MDYKEVKIMKHVIKIKNFCADKIKDEVDSLFTMMKLIDYNIDEDIWDYHNGDFIEYDFRKNNIRFRILFHINDEDSMLRQIDYYFHNELDGGEVSFKLIVQRLNSNRGANYHKEIENLFKVILNMA